MHNVWLMDVKAQPPVIMAQVRSADRATIAAIAQAVASAFPGPEFTLVQQVNAEPLSVYEKAVEHLTVAADAASSTRVPPSAVTQERL